MVFLFSCNIIQSEMTLLVYAEANSNTILQIEKSGLPRNPESGYLGQTRTIGGIYQAFNIIGPKDIKREGTGAYYIAVRADKPNVKISLLAKIVDTFNVLSSDTIEIITAVPKNRWTYYSINFDIINEEDKIVTFKFLTSENINVHLKKDLQYLLKKEMEKKKLWLLLQRFVCRLIILK